MGKVLVSEYLSEISINPSTSAEFDKTPFAETPRNKDWREYTKPGSVPQEVRTDQLPSSSYRIYGSGVFVSDRIIKSSRSLNLWNVFIDSEKYSGTYNIIFTTESRIDNTLQEIEKSINDIVDIEFDWDGRGFEKPSKLTLSNALNIMNQLLEKVDSNGYLWFNPFIYSNEDGYVCIGWHNESQALHFHIKNDDMDYRKIWCSANNVKSGSKEGYLNSQNCISLWKWLINE